MTDTHTTKEGNVISIAKLEDSHIINIIKLLEKKAEKGFSYECGDFGGDYNQDLDIGAEPRYTAFFVGIDALKKNHYFLYRKEAEVRKLKIDYKYTREILISHIKNILPYSSDETDRCIVDILNIELKNMKKE